MAKHSKKALAVGLTLVMCLSLLPVSAFAAEGDTPPAVNETVGDLPALEVTPDTEPVEDPYKTPYDEAKEADRLDGQVLTDTNDANADAEETANTAIGGINAGANEAAETAESQLADINEEIAKQNEAAANAAKAASEAAEKAKDQSLSLNEREAAVKDAEQAAEAAKSAVEAADEQVEAAKSVVAAAQAALDEANAKYEEAITAAKEITGDLNEEGIPDGAQQLIDDARALVEQAELDLSSAESAVGSLETLRGDAWAASETARIASEQAALAALGKQTVIADAEEQYSGAFVDSDKDTVDEKADAAISAKELEEAAKNLVDAQTKADDLADLNKLTTGEKELAEAKKAYDEATKVQTAAQEYYNAFKNDAKNESWLGEQLSGTNAKKNNAEAIGELLKGNKPGWLTQEVDCLPTLIAAIKAKDATFAEALDNLVNSNSDFSALEAALEAMVKEVKASTGAGGDTADEVLNSLSGKIGAINTDGKYSAELADLENAISAANAALNTAKDDYTAKGGNLNNYADVAAALNAASQAYSAAITALNTAAGTSLNKDTTDIQALNTLKQWKSDVEAAKALITEALNKRSAYTSAQETYTEKLEASTKANNQYQAAKAAVAAAKSNLETAKANPVKFSAKDIAALEAALTNANKALIDAEALKDKADEELTKAEEDADKAREDYEQAVADANDAINDILGDDPETGAETEIELDETAIPLAAGPVTRAQFVDYLWRHEGEPEVPASTFADVPADHEYAPAIGWAQSVGIISGGSFEPDELVTAAAVRDILGNFARVFGTNAVPVASLVSLTGDDGEAVLNCDEILAEFFGEAYAPALDGKIEIAA